MSGYKALWTNRAISVNVLGYKKESKEIEY